MNGFKKAVEKQDFGEFNKELTNGMNYWTNLFNTEVGALDPDEAPLIIAALEELASTYKKTVPGAGNIADTFRKNTKAYKGIFDVNRISKVKYLFPGHCAPDQEAQRLRYVVLNIKGKYLKCACMEAFQCSHRANSVPG